MVTRHNQGHTYDNAGRRPASTGTGTYAVHVISDRYW